MSSQIGVVILGLEYQALGLLRQLSTAGIPCVLVDEDTYGLAKFSRFNKKSFTSPAYTSPEFWPWLSRLATTAGCQGWVLIPTDDEQVRALAENYAEVTKVYRYAGLPWETYQHLYNKRLAYNLALKIGLSSPTTYAPDQTHPLPIEGSLGQPFIIKPAFKREYSSASKKKALLVHDNTELQQILGGLLSKVPLDQLIYQELIPGGGTNQWSYAGFFKEGQPIAAFTAIRRRQKPPDFGRSSTFVISQYNAEVEQESLKILSALNYTGLAEVEWKRNERTGKLLFLEVNARSWGWHSLASRVVGNLPLMLYRHLVEGVVTPVKPVYGAKWVKWVTDLPVAVDMMKRKQLGVREYLNSFKGEVISCEWALSDPMPFFLQYALVPYLIIKRGY